MCGCSTAPEPSHKPPAPSLRVLRAARPGRDSRVALQPEAGSQSAVEQRHPRAHPPQSRSTTSARRWERSQFMKLNKVRGGGESPGEGASALAGPAQLGLSTACVPASFPPGRAPTARPQPGARGQEPRGGRSRRSRGAAGPPPPRCAGRGCTSGGSAAGPSLWH